MEGSPTSLSLSDKDVGWYNKGVSIEEPQQENNLTVSFFKDFL
jgi:hypothetical protein